MLKCNSCDAQFREERNRIKHSVKQHIIENDEIVFTSNKGRVTLHNLVSLGVVVTNTGSVEAVIVGTVISDDVNMKDMLAICHISMEKISDNYTSSGLLSFKKQSTRKLYRYIKGYLGKG